LILILFLAILGKYFLMAALISLLFFIYVVFSTKPMMITHKITARGVDYNEKLYEWYMLDAFYFTKRNNQDFLIIETKLRFPNSLVFLLDEDDRLPIFLLLQEYVLYKDIRKQGRLEKMSFGEYIPLEEV
ncbi:MAG: transmembrane(s)protein, partial [candidate division WS6 bacterium 34_10]